MNAKSRWWAGGFGLLDWASPEVAAYAIERGAVVDVQAAARLDRMDRLRELISLDPSLVHARGGDGQTPLHFASSVEVATYLLDQVLLSMHATWTMNRRPPSIWWVIVRRWRVTWSHAVARLTSSWRPRWGTKTLSKRI